MIVVSNTSPLTNLAAIGRFNLLHEIYGDLHIPEAVWQELSNQGQIWPGYQETSSATWIARVTATGRSGTCQRGATCAAP